MHTMNRQKGKTALILLVAVLCVIVLLGIRGTRKTIDKTVPARVYEDNGTTYAPSSITISGTLKKTWSSTSFVGTFAMDGYEPSCRDGVEAKINWGDNEYPILTFFYAGNFSQLDVKSIDLLSVQLVYGDPVETRGKWGDKYYRSINPLPPSLSIQGNILSVDFMNALENLTITITDEQGTVIMEDNISGETGECITIILNNESTGRFYVKLEHQLGWLMGEFIIQNN